MSSVNVLHSALHSHSLRTCVLTSTVIASLFVMTQVVLDSFFKNSMSGSSNDHVLRDGDRPDEMGDIFSTLSSRQLSVLFGTLTNNPRRMVFMDQLQDIVVANADSIVRWATGGPPQKAMPKNNAKESTTLRPRDPSTAFRPHRPPRSSIMWRRNVATFASSPPQEFPKF